VADFKLIADPGGGCTSAGISKGVDTCLLAGDVVEVAVAAAVVVALVFGDSDFDDVGVGVVVVARYLVVYDLM